jgi:hypothetical protein
MALLNGMIRSAAVWGRTDTLDARVMGRQGGRWAQQTVRAAIPTATGAGRTPPTRTARASADPAEALRELEQLHRRGVVTDAEFEVLRTGL